MKLKCVTGDKNCNQNVRWNCFNFRHIIIIVVWWRSPGIIAIQSSHFIDTLIAWHPKIASQNVVVNSIQMVHATRIISTWTRKIAHQLMKAVDGVIGCGHKNIFLSPVLLFIVFDRIIESNSIMWCVNSKLFRVILYEKQINKDILWNSIIIYSKCKTPGTNTRIFDADEQ